MDLPSTSHRSPVDLPWMVATDGESDIEKFFKSIWVLREMGSMDDPGHELKEDFMKERTGLSVLRGSALFFAILTLLPFQSLAQPLSTLNTELDIVTDANGVQRVRGEFIVELDSSLKGGEAAMLFENSAADAVEDYRSLKMDSSIFVVRLNQNKSSVATLDALKSNPSVKSVEPNYVYQLQMLEPAQMTEKELEALAAERRRPTRRRGRVRARSGEPNDEFFSDSKLWGLKNTGQADARNSRGIANADINVTPLWARGITGSRNVTVAVIDTGVDATHEDLKDNIFTNSGEIAGNGIDDDNNGFIDDVHGWNFADDNADPNDTHGHGTHTAGTIGGQGNNTKGVVGVNWQVSIVPIKFLGSRGGTTADAIDSVKYATKLGVDIMNNSWGGGGRSTALENAIKEARDAGILFVAAAGNKARTGNDNDVRPMYPASYDVDNILAVAASNNKDERASFSHWGKNTVDVAAPGVMIWSTISSTNAIPSSYPKDGKYAALSGTSMAAPHVAGMAALIKSRKTGLTWRQLKRRLMANVDPLSQWTDLVVAGGRVDMVAAFDNVAPPAPPTPPTPPAGKWEDVAYTLESTHPYRRNLREETIISQPGVKAIRVHFERVELERVRNSDWIEVRKASGRSVEKVLGVKTNFYSKKVMGDKLRIYLRTDYSVQKWGFKIDKIQVQR